MRTKHTEDFWKQVEEQKEFNKQLSFIQELSEKQHSSVISNCLKEKCNFSHSVTTAQMSEMIGLIIEIKIKINYLTNPKLILISL